jgi:hypothetical protein
MRNLIEEGQQRLGIGEKGRPFGATRKGKGHLNELQESDPHHFDVAQSLPFRVGRGIFRRTVRGVGIRSKVEDRSSSTKPQETRPTGIGRILRNGGIGREVGNLPEGRSTPESEREERVIAHELLSTTDTKSRRRFKELAGAAIREERNRKELTEQRKALLQIQDSGQKERNRLAKNPKRYKTGLFSRLLGGGTWQSAIEVDQEGVGVYLPVAPGGEPTYIGFSHEQVAQGDYRFDVDPPIWAERIGRLTRAIFGRDFNPIGQVVVEQVQSGEVIGGVTVRNPRRKQRELNETIYRAARASISIPDPEVPVSARGIINKAMQLEEEGRIE